MFILVTVALMFFLVWMQSFTDGSSPSMQAIEVFEDITSWIQKMCGPKV